MVALAGRPRPFTIVGKKSLPFLLSFHFSYSIILDNILFLNYFNSILFCFVLFCFVLFCFVLFCFVLFCFVLFCFVLSCYM